MKAEITEFNGKKALVLKRGANWVITEHNGSMIITGELVDKLAECRTNFDKITQSVESLAEFLAPRIACGDCPYWKNRNCVASLPCEEALKEWLQKERE